MAGTGIKKWLILFAHGLAGWALCGAIIGIGRSVTSMENTLVIHAAGVPVIFGIISWVYHRKFHYTGPAVTALVFTLLAITMDAGLVAPVFEKELRHVRERTRYVASLLPDFHGDLPGGQSGGKAGVKPPGYRCALTTRK